MLKASTISLILWESILTWIHYLGGSFRVGFFFAFPIMIVFFPQANVRLHQPPSISFLKLYNSRRQEMTVDPVDPRAGPRPTLHLWLSLFVLLGCLCVPQIHTLKHKSQTNGIQRWGLWEVIRSQRQSLRQTSFIMRPEFVSVRKQHIWIVTWVLTTSHLPVP
jgi:hypothetical protein